MATRRPVEIDVFTGTFESQPLAFAHLYDLATALGIEIDLGAVEVICKLNPDPRLRHYFGAEVVDQITEAMGLNTTVILIFPEAMPGTLEGSTMLSHLGVHSGTRLQA